MTTPLWLAVLLIGGGAFSVLLLIAIAALDWWRAERRDTGDTLWLVAQDADPEIAYTLAKAVRRYEAGARG